MNRCRRKEESNSVCKMKGEKVAKIFIGSVVHVVGGLNGRGGEEAKEGMAGRK